MRKSITKAKTISNHKKWKQDNSSTTFPKSCFMVFCLLHLFIMFEIIFPLPTLMAADTMLLFVGEDLEVISLASRREEAAWKAPAIADVVTNERIQNTSNITIANLLAKSTGFYINEIEGGNIPFLRGIPDSTLFLYDTVPMGSSASKSGQNIDNETSLAAIKRIEIIRGAGSVLWGPDAFAGVINVVPFTGKDFQGVKTGISASSMDDACSTFLNFGADKGQWDSFLSISAKTVQEDDKTFNVIKFWNDGKTATAPNERFGEATPGNSEYYEIYSNLSFDNWLNFSARITNNNNAYSVYDWSGEYAWKEEQSKPTQTLKIEASKSTGIDSGIRFTGYYTNKDTNLNIIDKDFDQSEQSFYGELIYDHSMYKENGLLTAGASWRKTSFKDILIWQGFMPNYLNKENINLLPPYQTEDYENRLISVFGQYRQRFTNFEIWAGVRNDNHDEFENRISYSTGVAWDFTPNFILKSIYGTAYRTPFAKQVAEGRISHLERINSTNIQFAWKSGKEKEISFTLFRNKIKNQIFENRDAGVNLSTPNSQTIWGAELEWKLQLSKNFLISGNVTTLNNNGPQETSEYMRYDLENGQEELKILKYDYDTGAETMANVSLQWNMTENILFIPELRYIAETQLYYLYEADPTDPRATTTFIKVTYPDVWLMDIHLKITDIFPFGINFFVENIWDKTYETPGLYTTNSGKSFNAGMLIEMNW
ncbi:Outer membrane cobalamin receptor protein [Desulfocicer vacuolatum DSM 3385]|uniref:Outer membrane cobalamin receptor protein n=1 Tax=Desulfocicer vacuolatum DSM 3385 TaxID=1121400 RepID=A0A1W2BVA7_9BACT|nr:TonB-dependent receptor plug domain-containing protein [Desulfocicer vacuolatum]SMC76910.1 Outer membrane cobalamin receptor protein [Desulfocicer vacuolatum DSM 3385]